MSGKTTVKQLQQHGNDSEQNEFDDVIHDDPGDGNPNPEMEHAAMVEDDELGADSADVSYGVIEALDDYDLERLVYEERSYQEPTVHEETEDPIASETMEDRETQMQSQAGSSKTKKRRSTAVIFDPSDADPGCQTNLILRGTFYKRKFVGETSGSQVASETVVGNTVEEVLRGVWNIAKPFLCREVIFVDGSEGQLPTWADSEPSFEEMNRFIIMQDQGQKRRVTTDKIDSKLLVNWRSKDIKIHIHLYSISVSCRSLWDIVDKQLIRPQNADRAGAPNNQTVACLVEALREKHGMQFSGHSSSWRLWANYIHSCPAHEQQRRMDELPPPYLLKFFNSVPISPAVKLDCARSGLSVASTINDGFAAELEKLASEANQLIELGQRVKLRIAGMQNRLSINSNLVRAMQDSVRPEENELSQMLSGNVSDMPDIDHQ